MWAIGPPPSCQCDQMQNCEGGCETIYEVFRSFVCRLVSLAACTPYALHSRIRPVSVSGTTSCHFDMRDLGVIFNRLRVYFQLVVGRFY